jgi:tetratricopeptide (TPR) repeat protein
LCYPPSSPDRDDALLQAIKRLTPLARRMPPDDLTWNARVELAACLHELGQNESARKLVAAWLQENPPADVGERLSAQPASTAPRSNSNDDSAQEGNAFSAAMTAAAIERKAGRHAAAAEHFRRLALRYPNHARSGEAHQLAVLCMADVLRESPPAERPALAESYERLLKEHLTHWPRHASAGEIRLWLGQLLAGRRDWAGAVEVLQQVNPTSASFSESVPLLVRCYEEQLRQVDGDDKHEPQRRGELLAAASSYLQPIITGPDNRWPDPWSELQCDAAVALARLHLRFSAQPSPYAERLLTAALRGGRDVQDSAEDDDWEPAAQVLLIEALARNGKAAEARAMVDQLENVPAHLLPETLAAIDGQLADRSQMGADDRELGELALSMLRLIDARRSELDATASSRLGIWRAAALAAAGDRAAALAQYAALAAQSPHDGEIQERYAALLATSDSAPELRQALARWQEVESRSRRGGPRWRRARHARIELLTRLGERTEVEKLVRLTRLLYPDWDRATQNRE